MSTRRKSLNLREIEAKERVKINLIIGKACIWVRENGIGVIEYDGHVMASRASNVRVAALLKRAIRDFDLRLITGVVNAQKVIQVKVHHGR